MISILSLFWLFDNNLHKDALSDTLTRQAMISESKLTSLRVKIAQKSPQVKTTICVNHFIKILFDNAPEARDNAIKNLCADLILATKQSGEQINKWRYVKWLVIYWE